MTCSADNCTSQSAPSATHYLAPPPPSGRQLVNHQTMTQQHSNRSPPINSATLAHQLWNRTTWNFDWQLQFLCRKLAKWWNVTSFLSTVRISSSAKLGQLFVFLPHPRIRSCDHPDYPPCLWFTTVSNHAT